MKNKEKIGSSAEKQACLFLQQQGLRVLERNYRCRGGEIDLIMEDQETIVFVEVRYRASAEFGDSIESVDTYKQKKLLRAAEFYLQEHQLTEYVPCRFDIVGLSSQTQTTPEWVKDAFSA